MLCLGVSHAQPVYKAKIMSQRLTAVPGFNKQANDVIYHGPDPDASHEAEFPRQHIIYFGGDVQDYPEIMEQHVPHKEHLQWNLVDTSILLHKQFPSAHIWIIKPARMHLKSFAVYSHFLECNDFGNPEHSEGQNSLTHLVELFKNACDVMGVGYEANVDKGDKCIGSTITSQSDESQCDKSGHQKQESCSAKSDLKKFDLSKLTIILIGFSKGCIMLNQMLYDMKYARENCQEEVLDFVDLISDIYWLDGGHSGGSNTWVTDKEVLVNFAKTDIRVHTHVTPYQIRDEMRKWIGKEQAKFVKRLKANDKDVQNVVHFEDEDRSLHNHFRVLNEFKK